MKVSGYFFLSNSPTYNCLLGLSEHRAMAGFYAVILHLVLLYSGPQPDTSQDVNPALS